MGVPLEFEHPAVWEAIRRTIHTTRLHGKISGIMPASLDYAARCVEEGARLILWGPDLSMFQRAAREDARAMQERLRWKHSVGGRA